MFRSLKQWSKCSIFLYRGSIFLATSCEKKGYSFLVVFFCELNIIFVGIKNMNFSLLFLTHAYEKRPFSIHRTTEMLKKRPMRWFLTDLKRWSVMQRPNPGRRPKASRRSRPLEPGGLERDRGVPRQLEIKGRKWRQRGSSTSRRKHLPPFHSPPLSCTQIPPPFLLL